MLTFCFRFRSFPRSFRFLSSASFPVPATWPLFLPFRSLPVSASQWLPRCSVSAFASSVFPVLSSLVSHAFLPGSRTRLSACFLSSFPDSLPAAVPQVLTFCFRFRSFSRSFRFLSSASFPVPTTQPLFLPFLFSSRFASQRFPSVLRFHLSAFPIFPLLFRPVSRASFPVLSTWLSVCFLSSFPASLPQLFHRCFPSALASGLFPVLSAFFRPRLSRFRLLGLCLFLSLHPGFPSAVVLSGACLSAFRLRYSAFCSSFHRLTSRLAAATSFVSAFLSV